MYLAGLIADDLKMTRKDLEHWVDKATCHALCGSTVSWVAAESLHGWDLAREWIESRKETVAATGWATLSSLVGIKDDTELDLAELKRLLLRVRKTLAQEPNRVRHAMNGFVIAVGTYVQPLTVLALQTAQQIGKVSVDVGDTSCKVPCAPEYIEKVQEKGAVGKKRKSAKC
jgi:3-methyladenine DNA glycosylase AlkD